MSLRCGCEAEGDETVFGQIHECSKDPSLRPNSKARHVRDPGVYPVGGPLVPSSVFVVPAERPYETTLGPDELED